MLNFRVELSIVNEWLKANRLTLNAAKTKYVIFGFKTQIKDKPELHLTVGNEPIERVSCTKYLGVYLDEHLTFDEHVNYIHKKVSDKLGILYRANDYLEFNLAAFGLLRHFIHEYY